MLTVLLFISFITSYKLHFYFNIYTFKSKEFRVEVHSQQNARVWEGVRECDLHQAQDEKCPSKYMLQTRERER